MAFAVLLIGAVLTGPPALYVALSRNGPAPLVASGQSPQLLAREAAARSVAQDAVAAWLITPSAQASRLAAWWPSTTIALPDAPPTVSGVTVLGATATAPGVWQVSLAATVTSKGGAPRRQYYVLPVAVSGGVGTAAAQPLTLPAQVAGPGATVSASLPYTVPVPTGSPAGSSVAGFLQSLLTGNGDVSRWESPGSQISPVEPSAASVVSVTDISAASSVTGLTDASAPADGATVRVLVSAGSGPSPAEARSSQYLLTLKARAGRWEVLALDAAPAQSTPSSSS